MNLDKVSAFLLSCPAFDRDAKTYTEFIGKEASSYSVFISSVSTTENIIGGKTIRQGFVVYPKLEVATEQQRKANLEQIYAFCEWVETMDADGNYPDAAGADEEISEISAENPSLIALEDGTSNGLYQVQVYITYEKEARVSGKN